MKIYTRTGDSGQTGLLGGERVSKDHIRIAAYGDLDELNAVFGLVLAAGVHITLATQLLHLQHVLFNTGAELATTDPNRFNLPLLTQKEAATLEQWIDEMDLQLQPLRNFILPGGTPAAAALHLARTVCRRAERSVVTLAHQSPVRPEVIVFINRLSDYLFTASRYENHQAGRPETLWKP